MHCFSFFFFFFNSSFICGGQICMFIYPHLLTFSLFYFLCLPPIVEAASLVFSGLDANRPPPSSIHISRSCLHRIPPKTVPPRPMARKWVDGC